MREMFNINEDRDVRLWNKYLSNTFEPLNNKENTVQDAGLYEGQVILTIETALQIFATRSNVRLTLCVCVCVSTNVLMSMLCR